MTKPDDLRQADFSKLTVREMTPAQRIEMRRRFEAFMRDFAGVPDRPKTATAANVRKWVPGMKA